MILPFHLQISLHGISCWRLGQETQAIRPRRNGPWSLWLWILQLGFWVRDESFGTSCHRFVGQSACSKSDSPIFVLSRSSLPALRKVLFKFSRDMEIFSVHVGDSCFFLRLSGVQGVEVPFLCNTGVLLLLLCDVALRSAATLRLVERGELLLLPPLLPRRGCSSAVTDN